MRVSVFDAATASPVQCVWNFSVIVGALSLHVALPEFLAVRYRS